MLEGVDVNFVTKLKGSPELRFLLMPVERRSWTSPPSCCWLREVKNRMQDHMMTDRKAGQVVGVLVLKQELELVERADVGRREREDPEEDG